MLFLWALPFVLVLQEQGPLAPFCKRQTESSGFCPSSTTFWYCASKTATQICQTNFEITPTAADPVSVVPASLERETWCNEHVLHQRLDTVEEKVIKTVEHLESEVKSLLNMISETTENIPTVPGTPLIDAFDDTS